MQMIYWSKSMSECNVRVEARERQNKMVETKYKEVRTKCVLEFKQPDLQVNTSTDTRARAPSWEKIFSLWCVSSKNFTELRPFLSSIHIAVLTFRMKNDPPTTTKHVNKKPSSSVLSKEAVSNYITMLEKKTQIAHEQMFKSVDILKLISKYQAQLHRWHFGQQVSHASKKLKSTDGDCTGTQRM